MQETGMICCERCKTLFECKADSPAGCQCNTVFLTLNETQYLSEHYHGCLCANCLVGVRDEYNVSIGVGPRPGKLPI